MLRQMFGHMVLFCSSYSRPQLHTKELRKRQWIALRRSLQLFQVCLYSIPLRNEGEVSLIKHPGIRAVVKQCWAAVPSKRPDMSTVRSMIEDMRSSGKTLQFRLTNITADADTSSIRIICDYVRSRVRQ